MSFVLWLGGKKRLLPYINDIISDYLMQESNEIDDCSDVMEVGSIFWDYEHRLVTVTADTEDQIDQLERYE